jgi:HK97 family phage major capsid protein
MEKAEMIAALNEQLGEFRKGIITAEQMAEAIKGLEGKIAGAATSKEVADLKAALDEAKTAIKELRNTKKGANENASTFGEVVAGRIIEQLNGNKRAPYFEEFGVKAVAPVTLAGNVTLANPAPVLSTIVDAEVYKINRNQGANILDYVNLGTTDLATIVYVEEIGGEGDAGVTPEGEIKNATDVDFREVASSAIKVPATVKISEEMLSDAPNLAQAVEEITSDKVYRKVASRVVQAAIDKATEYDLTDYNGAVQDANMADAIHAALVQSEKSGFVPNALIINPVDFGSLRFIKSADGTPIVSYYGEGRFPVFSESLAIIKRTDMPAGSFVVGDLNAIKVRYYRRSVELGLSGDDFVRNLRTLRAEDRVHIYSPSTEAKSLVKGVFSTIVSALDAE